MITPNKSVRLIVCVGELWRYWDLSAFQSETNYTETCHFLNPQYNYIGKTHNTKDGGCMHMPRPSRWKANRLLLTVKPGNI